jgi:hypothetical protein
MLEIADKSKYIGEHITIDEAVELFPNRWIVIKDFSFENLCVEEGTLVDVMTDEEADKKLHNYIIAGYYYMRTTDNISGGYVNVTITKNKEVKNRYNC